jgi:cytochrome c-type biogenesis protein CcmF
MTSLIGLTLSKRRKYGGYIIHLGVAVMFIGFAGKAYDKMIDRTIDKPAITDAAVKFDDQSQATNLPAGTKSAWDFDGYTFLYEALSHTSDDHKDAYTAQVSVWKGGEKISTLYPGKWTFHKGEQQTTTEVAIKVRFAEDVYLVLTGFDLETQMSNFRVYLNPLISWVWIGFLILAFGTFICLIPQGVVDRVSARPRTRIGRAADLGILVIILSGVIAGLATQAHAAGAEHSADPEHVQAGMGMGAAGGGFAAMNRPHNDTEARAMKELLCICSCARQSIFDCECQTAANLRQDVMDILAGFDMTTDAGKKAGYDAVLGWFVKHYNGEQVLATPKSNASWLFPSLAVAGGLGLLFVVGRRWVGRSASAAAVRATELAGKPVVIPTDKDEDAAEKLDDELADQD